MNRIATIQYAEVYEASGITGNNGYGLGAMEIWYMKPSFTRDGLMGYDWLDEKGLVPNPHNLKDTHVLLARINENSMDMAYRMMQWKNPHFQKSK